MRNSCAGCQGSRHYHFFSKCVRCGMSWRLGLVGVNCMLLLGAEDAARNVWCQRVVLANCRAALIVKSCQSGGSPGGVWIISGRYVRV